MIRYSTRSAHVLLRQSTKPSPMVNRSIVAFSTTSNRAYSSPEPIKKAGEKANDVASKAALKGIEATETVVNTAKKTAGFMKEDAHAVKEDTKEAKEQAKILKEDAKETAQGAKEDAKDTAKGAKEEVKEKLGKDSDK